MKHVVIIGNSAAGISAAESIRKSDSQLKITVISEEKGMPYYRYRIADILSARAKESDIVFKRPEFYSAHNIQLILGKKAEKVNTAKNFVVLSDKTKVEYDGLIVASGMTANMSKEIKGINKHGVLGFRTIDNIRDILELIPITRTVCVLGSGIPALKAATALSQKGMEVKIICRDDFLLPDILDPQAAEFFQSYFQERNVEVLLKRDIVEIFGNGDVKAIKTDAGKVIGCGIVIIERDFVAQVSFLEDSGVKCENGIEVDKFLCTSCPNVFAAGDVIQRRGIGRFYSWNTSLAQGEIAARNIINQLQGRQEEMVAYQPASEWPTQAAEFFGLSLVCLGVTSSPAAENKEEMVFSDKSRNVYKKAVISNARLVGFLGVGTLPDEKEIYSRLISTQADISLIKNDLLSERLTPDLVKDLAQP
ncbi:MAG: FAD-dependent oxidoreductase [Candidatus Omnitrophica bacterium]|nr:FAD-dependent oxidoreductase [Candidatus Omnitrophota bacterium]MBU4478926.1 FAD-dependent oxidoreductase [Candidatus Omnitrophota bacterium]MCG2704385.1 FAD-dependent oxidoreductase [Candidatus Omnitrophota bacterium]